MGKPLTKEELIRNSAEGYKLLLETIDSLTAKERIKEWKTKERDKNIRDVIYHLYAWHELLLHWLNIVHEGGKPILPKEGYTWDDLDALNQEFWVEAQKHPLMDTLEKFEISHHTCMDEINRLSEEEIFTPYFPKLNHPIIGLLDGCMADHYEWAMNILKEHLTR